MKSKSVFLILLLAVTSSFIDTRVALAIRPMSAVIAMVAGDEGRFGFKDGSFTSALFDNPLGLAMSADGNSLFVADSGNNRIRIIHLDQDNEVTTLAGQSAAGKLDGPLTMAQFNDPRGVACLPDDRLVVNDYGNRLFRLVDLKSGTVTTLAGASPQPQPVGTPSAGAVPQPIPAEKASMDDVQGMAYLPAADSILYTQPASGSLKRLDLKTGLVSTLLFNNVQIPNPAALWCQDDRIYVADQNLPKVFEMTWNHDTVSKLLPAGIPLHKVLALSSNDDILYGLLDAPGIPAERFIVDKRYSHEYSPDNKQVSLQRPWGDTIPPDKYFPPRDTSRTPWMGFVPDPTDKRKFFVARPNFNMIVAFRDLFVTGAYNAGGLTAPQYPMQKPKNTFRIIIVGDSRSMELHDYPFNMDYHKQRPPQDPFYPQNLTFCPQVERELNFQAALNGVPWNFEVLNFGRHGDLLFWPTFAVPDVVKRNDIDLVIIFSPQNDLRPYNYYFDHSLASNGVPKWPMDMEYFLKPPLERIPDGLPRKFYDYCKAHNMVKVEGKKLHFFDEKIMADPKLHDWVIDFYGKPLDELNRKLAGMRTSGGKPVRLLALFTYTGREWSQHYDTDLWIEAAKKFKFPYLDLEPEVDAMHLSYYPLTSDDIHFNPDGSAFFGRLLAQVLIRDKLIPWNGGAGKEGKAPDSTDAGAQP